MIALLLGCEISCMIMELGSMHMGRSEHGHTQIEITWRAILLSRAPTHV